MGDAGEGVWQGSAAVPCSMSELREAYQKATEVNSRSSVKPQTCCFYSELRALLFRDTRPPQTTMVTTKETESQTPAMNSKQEEEGDGVMRLRGSAMPPSSQSWQLSLGEPDAGEGTLGKHINV